MLLLTEPGWIILLLSYIDGDTTTAFLAQHLTVLGSGQGLGHKEPDPLCLCSEKYHFLLLSTLLASSDYSLCLSTVVLFILLTPVFAFTVFNFFFIF